MNSKKKLHLVTSKGSVGGEKKGSELAGENGGKKSTDKGV